MNFANPTVSVDYFEVILLVVSIFSLAIAIVSLRSGWREFRWGLSRKRLSMRNLGVVQIAVAIALFLQVIVILEVSMVSMLVPSAINEFEDTLDTVIAINVRLAFLALLSLTTCICALLNWYRSEATMIRSAAPDDDPATEPTTVGTVETPVGEIPVVSPPVVVVPEERTHDPLT